ncbi:inorganic polyphosphate kinase [Bacillus sp. FJAT-18017]|uniref:NAD kinase n=1 Tax=Bacillus sp. FJAT-18017 TaxID=1705566 RepID=UPI0006AF07D2|nr:NAD kinase [Bacillus sp. FJAT-18017]ALC89665.1 inorganic polyphosphate kinase [Bacillus sp. FJAT-18017]
MPNRKNLYLYHSRDAEILKKVKPIYDQAEKYGFTLVKDYHDANIITSIGGEGTFLQAVQKTGFRDDCLYVGISTSESLSMYCDFQIDNLEGLVEAASQNDQIEVRRYPTIEVTVDDESKFQCLNEFSIKSSIIKTFVLDVYIDDLYFETFRGDGMIVATPTGSTAYNKSVNGAIVDPLLPCMQVSELASVNNNRFRTLGSSFILSGDRTLTLKVVKDGNDYPTMGMDNEALSVQHVEKVQVKLSNKIIKTVKLKDNSFWEKVKRTFL